MKIQDNQDFLGIRIEVSEAMFFDKMQSQRAMADGLRKKVRDTLGVTPRIWLVEAGSIRRDAETAPMVVDADLEHAALGGRGIHLLKSYSDAQHYGYISGKNRLKLVLNKQR